MSNMYVGRAEVCNIFFYRTVVSGGSGDLLYSRNEVATKPEGPEVTLYSRNGHSF
jgi:hypothetical protein